MNERCFQKVFAYFRDCSSSPLLFVFLFDYKASSCFRPQHCNLTYFVHGYERFFWVLWNISWWTFLYVISTNNLESTISQQLKARGCLYCYSSQINQNELDYSIWLNNSVIKYMYLEEIFLAPERGNAANLNVLFRKFQVARTELYPNIRERRIFLLKWWEEQVWRIKSIWKQQTTEYAWKNMELPLRAIQFFTSEKNNEFVESIQF